MKPFVSVLIPAYNEEEDIAKCLQSVKCQDYPIDRYEVIVMDNGSTDKTKEIAARFNVKIVDASGMKIGGVRNFGAKMSIGSIFAYIDADCIAPENWIRSGVSLLLSSQEVGAVGGGSDIRGDANWVEKAWILSRSVPGVSYRKILATGSFFIGKEDFLDVGGFNDSIEAGEDTEISRKLVENNKKLLYSTEIRVVHLGFPRTVTSFLLRQIWQSSDYLKSKKSLFDPIFILTNISLITLVFSAYYLVLWLLTENTELSSTFLPLTLNLMLPVMLSVYRYRKSKRPFEFFLFLQVIFLNHIYLLARIFGLLKSYSKGLRLS
jgi:glycosyltransferase involved in cell wall biosynthesis